MNRCFLHCVLFSQAILVCAGSAFPAWAANEIRSAEALLTPETGIQSPQGAPRGNIAIPVLKRIELAPVSAAQAENALTKRAEESRRGAPRQIGFARDVAALKSSAMTSGQLAWQAQADGGQAAAIAIVSPGAVGMRLGVRIFKLPTQAVLRVHTPGAGDAFETSGQEILDLIAANVISGDTSEEAHTWWTPTVEAREAVLEIILPPGVPPETVEIALPEISHLFASASTGWEAQGAFAAQAAALSCHPDVRCHPDWDTASRATARMTFTDSTGTYLCTGVLLNDNDATTAIPYFLTAEHCIATQTAASSLATYWFYRSPSCNGAGYDAQMKQLAGGAALLYHAASTDTAFLRLNGAPPAGAAYAGWQVGAPVKGTPVTGVHNPRGERQKIAFGAVSSLVNIYGVPLHSSGTPAYIEITWSNGVTEKGSSGSGLFDNSGQKLIGQLYGGYGTAACSGASDYYGRFDLAFSDKLHEFLDPASTPPPSPGTPSTGAMRLRDAVYLYGLPVAADQAKTLVGYNCDVFQLLLDVDSGYTDIVLHESSAMDYPDRIYDHAAMFSYALYSTSPRKGFGLRGNRGGGGQIGAVTAFGYCFSSHADAKALLHDAATGICQLSNKTTVPCGANIPAAYP
ncbi:MAG: serine protease [Azoarcus sp.]|nr:serine protease [Azoarcus sp.]